MLENASIKEHVCIYNLRHIFATMILFSDVDALTSMLGYCNTEFTLDTYTHITADMWNSVAKN